MGNWEEAALALACLACSARFGVKIAKCNARMISQPVSS